MTKHPDKDTSRRILDFLKEHCGESYTAVEINVAVFHGDDAFWGAPGDVPLPEIKSALEVLAGGRMVERDGTRTLDRRVNLPGATADHITITEPTYRASRLACALHRMGRAPMAFCQKVRHPRISSNTARLIGAVYKIILVACALIGTIIAIVVFLWRGSP